MSDTSQYQVVVEDAGPARKRISITIPSAIVDSELSTQMSTISGNVNLPGFRKGKIPQSVIEKRFGDAVRDETRNELVRGGLEYAIETNDLEMLQQPEPSDDTVPKVETGQDFTFSVEMDVVPNFEFPDFSSIEIIRPMLDVMDDHLNEELERQCLRSGTGESLQADFQLGDRLMGRADCTRRGEDEPFFSNEQVLIVLPEAGARGEILGLMVDDVYSIFSDQRVGDHVRFDIDVPDNYEREDIRGMKVIVDYQIHVAERIEPCTLESLAEQYQLASVDVLKEQIRLAMEQRRDEEQAIVLREQARDQAVKLLDVEVPEKMSAAQVSSHLDRVRLGLLERGEDEQKIETQVAEAREDTEQMTNAGIKLMFLHKKLINQYEITVDEQEVNAQIVKLAMQRGVRPEEFRAQLAQNNQLGQISTQILENKAADAMVQQMKIVEKSSEDWKKDRKRGDSSSEDGTTASKKKKKKTKKKTSSTS